MQKLFDLAGKSALVTGAGSGIGFAMAECLAENNARVFLADINDQNLARALKQLSERGFSCDGEVVDASDRQRVFAVTEAVVKRFGGLDIAIANAGISAGPGPMTEQGTIEAVDPKRWSQVCGINLDGVFFTMQAAANYMKPQRSGRIIVTASTAGFRADPMVGYAYAATKAAVVNLVRHAAMDLARFDVRVNGIAPGPFRTNIGNGRMQDLSTENSFAESVPLGRIGDPQEIKGVTLLLASQASSFITGAIVPVDGGSLSW